MTFIVDSWNFCICRRNLNTVIPVKTQGNDTAELPRRLLLLLAYITKPNLLEYIANRQNTWRGFFPTAHLAYKKRQYLHLHVNNCLDKSATDWSRLILPLYAHKKIAHHDLRQWACSIIAWLKYWLCLTSTHWYLIVVIFSPKLNVFELYFSVSISQLRIFCLELHKI